MLATASLALYFLLNLLVTVSNKAIIQSTACPYLLTLSHATATFLSTSILWPRSSSTSPPPRPRPRPRPCPRPRSPHAFRRRLHLALFSALFTANITLSNFSLGLVSLPVHQTIRAIAPLLTIAISIILRLKTPSSYRAQTYLSLLPIVFGVVVASSTSTTTATPPPPTTTTTTDRSITTPHSTQQEPALFGVCMTLLGAVTAVLKTIATHSLQADLGIPSYELIHITAPLAAAQGLVAAWLHGEFTMLQSLSRGHAPLSLPLSLPFPLSLPLPLPLILLNALLAAALNLASFEANKRYGPLTMGVAANLKQVAVLFVPDGRRPGLRTLPPPPARNVVIGSLATVLGGLWYAVAQIRQ